MQSQWDAISERHADEEWVAYFRTLPVAASSEPIRLRPSQTLEHTASLLLSAGFGGVSLGDDGLAEETLDEEALDGAFPFGDDGAEGE